MAETTATERGEFSSTAPPTPAVIAEALEVQRQIWELDALQKAAADKEKTVEMFNEQILRLRGKYCAQLEDLRQESADSKDAVAQLQKLLEQKSAALEELQLMFETATQRQTTASADLETVHKRNVRMLVASGKELLAAHHVAQRQFFIDEARLRGTVIQSFETAARSHLALHATSERAAVAIRRLRATISAKDKEIIRLQSEVVALSQKYQKAIEAHANQIKVQTQKNGLLEESVESERQQVVELKERLKAAHVASELKSDKANERILAAQAAIEMLQQKIGGLEKDVEAATGRAMAAEQSLASTCAARDAASAQLNEWLMRGNSLQHEISARDQELHRLTENFKHDIAVANEAAAAQAKALRQQLHDTVIAHHKDTDAMAKAHADIVAEHVGVAEHLRALLRNLEQQAEALRADNGVMVSALEESRAEVKDMAVKIVAESSHKEALGRKNQELEATVQSLRGHLDASATTHAALKKDLSECTERERRLAGELAATRAELDQTARRRDGLTIEVGGLNSANATLGHRIGELEAENSLLKKKLAEASERQQTLQLELDCKDSPVQLKKRLSTTTQACRDLESENKELKERLTVTEARYMASATKLHHSIQEGAGASALLEKGLSRIQNSAMVNADVAETKLILSQAAYTLRAALEEQGYDLASLPLTPGSTLELPYLQQVLLDHAAMCANHIKKSSGQQANASNAGAIPSALRTPMIYKSGNHSRAISE